MIETKRLQSIVRTMRVILLVSALLGTNSGGQEVSAAGHTKGRTGSSPVVEETARLIGVKPLLDRLDSLPPRDRGAVAGTMSLEALSLREQISEDVLSVALEVFGVVADIDNERAQITEVRDYLDARSAHSMAINHVANVVIGTGLGMAGTAMQFSNATAFPGDGVGVAAGTASTLLSLIGMRRSRGRVPGVITPGPAYSMLATFLGRPATPGYPEIVWRWLNTAPSSGPAAATWREQLVQVWTASGRIQPGNTPKTRRNVELLTASLAEPHRWSARLLANRAAMLADVRARVVLMERNLGALMLALKAQ